MEVYTAQKNLKILFRKRKRSLCYLSTGLAVAQKTEGFAVKKDLTHLLMLMQVILQLIQIAVAIFMR